MRVFANFALESTCIIEISFNPDDYDNAINCQRFPSQKEIIQIRDDLEKIRADEQTAGGMKERRYEIAMTSKVSRGMMDQVMQEQKSILGQMDQQAEIDPELKGKLDKQKDRIQALRSRIRGGDEETPVVVPPPPVMTKDRALSEKLAQLRRKIDMEKSPLAGEPVKKKVESAKEMASIINEQMKSIFFASSDGEDDDDLDLLSINPQKK
jgi:hypothetical protein